MGERSRGCGGALGGPYADYAAPELVDLLDIVRRARACHASAAAFERVGGVTTYAAWADGVDAVSRTLSERLRACPGAADPLLAGRPLVHVCADDPELLTTAFLGSVASGCVALLGPASDASRADVRACAVLDEQAIRELMAGTGGGASCVDELPISDLDAPCCVLRSSGSSGSEPKLVVLSQRALVTDLLGGLRRYAFPPACRTLSVIPAWHGFGLVCDALAPLAVGGTICIPDTPAASFAQLSRFAPTQLNVPPRFAAALLGMLERASDPKGVTGGRLRKMLVGGAGVDAVTCAGLRGYDIEAYGCYGLSECAPCVSVNRDAWRKDGSAGLPLDCNEVRIASDGEILVRGSNVMAGYLGRPDLTSRALRDGWLHTGDVGRIDDDGFLWVEGRLDGLIVLADGTGVVPEPWERAVCRIEGVRQALVYGWHGPQGTCLAARVFAADAATDVAAAVRGVCADGAHHIEHVELASEPLATTPTGKLVRSATPKGER
ncbi:MAG: AMP-binding protein [Coriobacteriia bacterium]|nr:AMP-binding protein [Coriobacteriia bacterium]MBS5477898.1 AMP-binding protein [Coriobacteriia bacterium]